MRILMLILMVLFPFISSAQVSGGQIKRNKTEHSSRPSKNISRHTNNTNNSREGIIRNIIDNMVYVEGGSFLMGATREQDNDAYDSEKPLHNVKILSFRIGKYEVKQEEWETIMGNNPSVHKNSQCPVENISWNQCQQFIRKLNEITGRHFRLPTEAEWEYAARGGKKGMGNKYSGHQMLAYVAWYEVNSKNSTHEVGCKEPNELGLYDMSGNVWEWCQDWSGKYNSNTLKNPTGPLNGKERIIRGGSFFCDSKMCRVSVRSSVSPDDKDDDLGFRLVCDLY